KSLAQRHQVRNDSVVLASEHSPAAPHAALDLIKDEQGAVSITDFPRGGEVAGRRDIDPALSLNRLKNDRGDALPREIRARDDGPQGIDVPKRYMRPVLERKERLPEHRFRGAAERPERFAVKGADRSDEMMPARRQHRHLEASLDRLGPGVCQES